MSHHFATIAKLLLLLFVMKIGFSNAQSFQVGVPEIEYFGTKDYSAGIQNYCISQDARGTIFVANNKGILHYDGTDWNLIETPGGTIVRSILPKVDGRVYVGMQNDLGYYYPDSIGMYQYHTLAGLINDEYIAFDFIWDIYPTIDGCIFMGTKEMFIYDGLTVTPIRYPVWSSETFYLNSKLYKQLPGQGLMYYDNNEWVLHPQGEFFSNIAIAEILAYNNDKLLICTYEDGLFLVDSKSATAWSRINAQVFKKNKINSALRLTSGLIAIGTNSDGVYFLNIDGSIYLHISQEIGLDNNTVLDIFEDSFGNVWLGHNNGISKIELNSPFSYLNDNIGLSGTGYVIYHDDKYTYLGTNNGLYYYPNDPNSIIPEIKKIQGVEGQVYSIQSLDGDIVVGCHIGAYQLIDGISPHVISSGAGWWIFKETEDPERAIGGGYNGLFLLKKKNGLWDVIKYYSNFNESSRIIEIDDDQTLWVTHFNKGVFSIVFSDDYEEIDVVNFYGKEDGFKDNRYINMFEIQGNLLFPGSDLVYQYNKNQNKFEPDKLLNSLIPANERLHFILEDDNGDIYFLGEKISGLLKKEALGYAIFPDLFVKFQNDLNDDLINMSILNRTTIALAANNGFILYNHSSRASISDDLNLIFRNVKLSNSDSIIFAGNFVDSGKVVINQPVKNMPEIEFEENSINFKYVAIDYNSEHPQYQYRLAGFENKWSEWSPGTKKEYTNLGEGNYSFEVKARNVFGVASDVASYRFTILPPWYRTKLAITSYTLIIFILVTIVIWYSLLKRKLIVQQEKELGIKSFQLKKVTKDSEKEITKLNNEKLDAEIRHKQKELATSTMHLIDKNDFITSIRDHISSVLKENPHSTTKNELKRIIKDIDKNIKNDDEWGHFELYFDDVHDGFIRRLKEAYPNITPQEVKLSAYLRMNMTTKEVANLLKISVRGVEMGRYRLRKKLGIDKDTNLVDFMMSF